MNTLYFFRARHNTKSDQIVFLLTAASPEQAKEFGLAFISENARQDYTKNVEVEVVCQTPATILCFEPV